MRTITDKQLRKLSRKGRAGEMSPVPEIKKVEPPKQAQTTELIPFVKSMSEASANMVRNTETNVLALETIKQVMDTLQQEREVKGQSYSSIPMGWVFKVKRDVNGLIETITAERAV